MYELEQGGFVRVEAVGAVVDEFVRPAEADEIASIDWHQEAYRGVLTLQFPVGTVVPIRAEMVFDTETSGSFKGRVLQSIPFEIRGDFTAVPIAP